MFREHARLSAFENDGTRAFDIGAYAELTDMEYDALQPFQWPRRATDGIAATGPLRADEPVAPCARPFADGRFYTSSGKAQLVATPPRAPADRPSAEYPLVLNTGRIRDQWHTMTRTGRSARLMAHNPEPFALAHPIDAARFGITSGDLVEVRSATGRIVVRAEVRGSVGVGRVFVPMHWSAEFASHARVGALIAAAADPVSGQPELKHTAVSIHATQPAWYGFALSREPLAIDGDAYLARARGQGYWRYELAGERMPASWPEWADALLGPRAERVELIDSAGRYRGARVIGERLQACVFIARTKALPSRGWIAGLFAEETLSDASRLAILSGRPSKPALESGPIVCSCFAVGRSTLLRAIRTQELLIRRCDRQGAARRYELRVLRAGAQGADRRSGGSGSQSSKLLVAIVASSRARSSCWSSVPLHTPPQRLTPNFAHDLFGCDRDDRYGDRLVLGIATSCASLTSTRRVTPPCRSFATRRWMSARCTVKHPALRGRAISR